MRKFRVADESEFVTDATNIYDISSNDKPDLIYKTIIGKEISQDKTISQISGGYMLYFKTENGLKSYSAFHYTVKKRDN